MPIDPYTFAVIFDPGHMEMDHGTLGKDILTQHVHIGKGGRITYLIGVPKRDSVSLSIE